MWPFNTQLKEELASIRMDVLSRDAEINELKSKFDLIFNLKEGDEFVNKHGYSGTHWEELKIDKVSIKLIKFTIEHVCAYSGRGFFEYGKCKTPLQFAEMILSDKNWKRR